ncbi:ABC transporter permease [Plantactinospora sp. S1510]|uniref:ABC transporter permease n=1 Tax=Plantactinospora alkalitolerans TaxID=2789879 RepID=A0ABS0GPC9_9ACTN|nr:ABC transporter permease [Plantactinospora alkalitolerans]MBF9128035.1 ABC transporter permease [Plantactinospora alkalitolerans]
MTSRSELSRSFKIGLPIVGTVVAIGLWWLVTIVFGIETFFLPSPPDVVDAFSREPHYLLEEAWATLWVTLAGFAVAAVAGMLGGMLLTGSRMIEQATLPMVVAFNAVPKVSLVPLLIVWVDFGPRMRISMVVLIAFFPILVSTMAGLTSTPADLNEFTRSLSASRLKSYLKVRLPWALPQLFVGLKVGITLALIGTVVAEIQSPNGGLGSIIAVSNQSADTSLAFAAIALLAVFGVSLFYLVVAAERLAVPWARHIST